MSFSCIRKHLIWMFFLASCQNTLLVDSVLPQDGPVEEDVLFRITGKAFSPQTRIRLENSQRSIELVAPVFSGKNSLEVFVPRGIPRGEYDLVLQNEKEEAIVSNAYSALGSLRLISIDVGQGDATLIIGPTGKSILFDVGPDNERNSQGNPSIEGVRNRLDIEGVFAPDIFIASHFHRDHVGALEELLQGEDGQTGTFDDRLPPEGIFDRGEPLQTGGFTESLYRNVTLGLRESVFLGQQFSLGGGAFLEVVAVDGFVKNLQTSLPVDRDDENQRSIALLLEVPKRTGQEAFRALLLGDLSGGGLGTFDIEGPVADEIGVVDVLRVSHHGSETGTSISFLQKLQPKVALLSVGEDNDFCHPDSVILGRLSTFAPQATTFLTSGGILTDGLETFCCTCQATETILEKTSSEEVVSNGDVVVEVSLFANEFFVNGKTF